MAKKKETVKIKQTESSKKIPAGVQIISVFYYICAGLCVLLGLLVLILAKGIASYFGEQDAALLSVITPGLIVGLGVFLMLLGVLTFFIGRGLWRLRSWARILAIILGVVVAIYSIYSMITGFAFMQIINLAISGAIAIYLIVDKEAKGAFK